MDELSTYPRLDVQRLGCFVEYLYDYVVRELFERVPGLCTVFRVFSCIYLSQMNQGGGHKENDERTRCI